MSEQRTVTYVEQSFDLGIESASLVIRHETKTKTISLLFSVLPRSAFSTSVSQTGSELLSLDLPLEAKEADALGSCLTNLAARAESGLDLSP